ncbi:MAG TPA: M24B family metallopeptidase, partial [Oligoflexia bacterium]|nr:M24B family metallopeptidase [Oligoflexia bacterium]
LVAQIELIQFRTLINSSLLLQGADRFYYSFYKTNQRNGVEHLDQKILRHLDSYRASQGRSGRGFLPIFDAAELLGEMRIFKSPEELDRLRRAGDITARVHTEVMARTKAGLYEFQIEALLEYLARDAGCERHGYPSIVAGGKNATILHYVENAEKLNDGELLLIDAGFECDYHTADITRTYPINGKMSAPQQEIYQVVLNVQKECIRLAKPGATLAAIHAFAIDALTDAMIALKFLSGDRKKLIETLAYKRYYPHGTGHLLGMDVHDAGLYQQNGAPRLLEPGMVFTIEPGFYVLHDDAQVPAHYRGIGVRIEDDVVITPEGCEVLTAKAPKEIADMASVIGTKPWLTV